MVTQSRRVCPIRLDRAGRKDRRLSMSTISNKTITQTVTLGSVNSYPTYASPLTITATGTVAASTGDGVYGAVALFGSINNAGRIKGGFGSAGSAGSAGNTGSVG